MKDTKIPGERRRAPASSRKINYSAKRFNPSPMATQARLAEQYPLPERLRGTDLQAYEAALAFIDEGISVYSLTDFDDDAIERFRMDSYLDARFYFCERHPDTRYLDDWRADDWPQVCLTAAAVIEIDAEAMGALRELVQRHRLPPGALVSRTREDTTQLWFLHVGLAVRPANSLPPGVRLKRWDAPDIASATTPAPVILPKNLPKRLRDLDLPSMPLWLAQLTGVFEANKSRKS